MNELAQKIEGLLLYKNEPVTFTWLSRVLEVPKDHIQEAINTMLPHYEQRGITLVVTHDSAAIMTADVVSGLITGFSKNREERELSKQALETLAIIMYKSRVTKAEIDYIRGVNSVFILRNLLIRGLISKKPNLLDKRSPIYVPTHDLLSFLGINSIETLPGFDDIKQRLADLEDRFIEDQKDEKPLVVGDTSFEE
jgi:segregation and condensation protein B